MRETITVSELTQNIRALLENNFQNVRVIGEISNWKVSPSGHAYCSLKDDKALLQSVMFRGRLYTLNFSPEDGQQVIATGAISVYEPRGQYQFVIESMVPYGKGSLLSDFEERKNRLASEGLFDLNRKKTIPSFPCSVAVITSPNGAAVHDVINTLQRRAPHCIIRILPALMQGTEAPEEIIKRIQQANTYQLAEVIIIARGGGSSEDLSVFSDEKLVRAVAHSLLPTISAVGHETDWTLCDFAADLRAPTPTAAAELVSASTVSLQKRMKNAQYACITAINSKIQILKHTFEKANAETMKLRIIRLYESMSQRLDYATTVSTQSMTAVLSNSISLFNTAKAVIESANPSLILSRGYAIVKNNASKTIIVNAMQIKPHDSLLIQFQDGSITATAEEQNREKARRTS